MKYLGQPQSGSQANTTASHNRAGQYLRNRRSPVIPTRTPKQGILRGKFGSASASWQSLPSDLQAAWTAFAHGYPVKDSLGQSIVLTGQQYYIGIQTSLMNAGQPINTAVPTNTSTPAVDTPTLTIADDGTITVSVASVSVGDFILVGCSPVKSNGVNFNKQFSQFAVLTSSNLSADITEVYEAQYGAVGVSRKIFARFKEVNSSGMTGPDLIIQTSRVLPTAPTPTIATDGANEITVTFSPNVSSTVRVYDEGTGAIISTTAGITTGNMITGLTTGVSVVATVQGEGQQESAKSNAVTVL